MNSANTFVALGLSLSHSNFQFD